MKSPVTKLSIPQLCCNFAVLHHSTEPMAVIGQQFWHAVLT